MDARGTVRRARAAQRLHVTAKTIEAHLTRIFRKLGVASRGEMIAVVGRHGVHEADHIV